MGVFHGQPRVPIGIRVLGASKYTPPLGNMRAGKTTNSGEGFQLFLSGRREGINRPAEILGRWDEPPRLAAWRWFSVYGKTDGLVKTLVLAWGGCGANDRGKEGPTFGYPDVHR